MGKTILGLFIILLVFGGIFYYSVQRDTNNHYQIRLATAYNGILQKKDVLKKGTHNEIPRLTTSDSSFTVDRSLFNTLLEGDSIIKTPGADTVLIFRSGKRLIYKMLEPVFLRKKNYEVAEMN